MKFKNKKYLKLFIFGAGASLAFAPFYLCVFFFFSLYYLLSEFENCDSIKKSFFIGWWFGFGYFIGNCYWYCCSLLLEPLKYAWLIPFAISIIPAYLACYIGFATFFTYFLVNKYAVKNRFFVTVIFSFFWIFFEYLRGIIFTGFPWNSLCYCLSFSPLLIQTVSLWGCYIFSFFILTIFTSFWVLRDKKYKMYFLYYIILILFVVVFGFFRLKNADVNFSAYKIRIVQPNISIWEKSVLSPKQKLNNLIDESLNNIEDIKYILWPESALPDYILTYQNNGMADYIGEKIGDKVLITGGIRVDEYKNKIYNSVFVIDKSGVVDYYDKYNLVPFGEFVPFRKILPFVNSIASNLDLSRAEKRRKMIVVGNNFPTFSPNICYESIFTSSINRDADLIINFTNDFWFGKTSGPYQHFDALRFRALENAIPAVRVANSGISAVIDKYGRVIKKTKLGESAVLDINIPLK